MTAAVSDIRWSSELSFVPVSAFSQISPSGSGEVNEYQVSRPRTQTNTDKIILPPSALSSLVGQVSSDYGRLPSPMIFKVSNAASGKHTHVGVREFSAPEGVIVLPSVVSSRLELSEPNGRVSVQFVELPKGTALTIKPLEGYQDVDDYKALLEAQLNSAYTALTKGDELEISDPTGNVASFKFVVEDVRPADAVCIVDTDLDLEIAPMDLDQARRRLTPKGNDEVGDLEAGTSLTVQDLGPNSFVRFVLRGIDKTMILGVDSDSVLVVVGTDSLSTSRNSFLFSNLTGSVLLPASSSYFVVAYNTSDSNQTFVLSTKSEEASVEPGYKTCDNCLQAVPEQSYMLHTTFCARNNIRCKECGQVFKRQQGGIPAEHWHCTECLKWGIGSESHEDHSKIHLSQICSCGARFNDIPSVAKHRATECPNKLIICRFCHLKLPQGEASPVDTLQGLTGHESDCGNKTEDCEICHRAVRRRDIEAHMSYHSMERLSKSTPRMCSNHNCYRPVNGTAAATKGLCANCFGPLHSDRYDPTESKLNSRIERRYVIQLTRGCGRQWCMNEYCKTGNIGRWSSTTMGEIMPVVQRLVQTTGEFWFCVDELTTKRRMFVDFEAQNGEYSVEWAAQAIEQSGNEQEAKSWLRLNAVKVSESGS